MDTRSPLFTFLCVYRHGSQAKAADFLHLTQPAVSQQLKVLEERLAKPLFKREGRKLVPTTIAHQLALQIAKPIDCLEAVWNELKLQGKGLRTINIGGLSEFLSEVICPHLGELSDAGLRCRFTFGYANLTNKLRQKELDIAQFCAHVAEPGIEMEKFFTEEFVLIAHPKWAKLVGKDLAKNPLDTLHKLPWVAFDESLLFIKEYFLTGFGESFDTQTAFTLPNLWSMLQAVIGGAGVTVLPSYFCKEALAAKKVIVLHKPPKPPRLDFYLGWKDGALANPQIKKVKLFMQKTASRYSV
ncbi:MAG: LysR family transcriptional regulator [Proteobacteria bacterium]|nr:LysR family transcriptional regulator [Pseudomonadota bacterium]